MDDKQIEKLAIAVTNALNKSETVGKRKIVDNSKKIKSLQKEIEKKKKLLQWITMQRLWKQMERRFELLLWMCNIKMRLSGGN